jgi:hypothetical protein
MAVVAVAGTLAAPAVAQQYPQQQYPQQQYPQQQYPQQQYPQQQYPQQQYPQQQYPQQEYPQQNGQYDNGQYPTDPNYAGDPADEQGVYAPAPPPIPSYAYDRPPLPGPDYSWVDGYWNFAGGRYIWVRGYWGRPPYAGGYWVRPHYSGGRFFAGFWGGRSIGVRGFVRNDYRYSGRYSAPREVYRVPASRGYSFRGDHRSERSRGHFERGRR